MPSHTLTIASILSYHENHKCLTCGGLINREQSSIFQLSMFTTLMSPKEGETAVCGSLMIFAIIG